MNILSINCGSSSLKIRLSTVDACGVAMVADGAVDAIGPRSVTTFHAASGAASRTAGTIGDHTTALRTLLDLIGDAQRQSIEAVGHRVVQGGVFTEPCLIDNDVLHAIDAERGLAPLHNGPCIEGILAARELLPGVPMVAVFDTAFHTNMPAAATHYALPHQLALKHGLRRYGYHGIAHRFMTERYAALTDTPYDDVSLITLQLGNGCSATAVRGGVSVDTSMGFTPLEGLMMGTRPGDLDAGVLAYLVKEAGMSAGDLDRVLNHESGLLGVSGSSADMAVLLGKESGGDERAHEAIEMFCYRVRKYIGAYLAVLGEAQSVVFGGGIGERSPEIRRRICEPLEPLGLHVDGARNAALVGNEGRFSRDGGPISLWAIPSDEERVIARDTFDLLSRSSPNR